MAAPFSRRLLVASVVASADSQNGGFARSAPSSQKKSKKRNDDDEIRTHAILEGFTPVAEKMDCYVSHFLTGIIAGKNWPPRAVASVRKTLKFV